GITMTAFVGIYFLGGTDVFIDKIPKEKLYFSLNFSEQSEYIYIFLLVSIPYLVPETIQRLLMARDAKQAADAFKAVAFIKICVCFFVGCIAFIAICLGPNLNANTAFFHVVDKVLPCGFRGVAITGLLAVIMSTADSLLNATSICLTHDVIKPLSVSLSGRTELRLTQFLTFVIGNMSILVVLYFESIYDIVISTYVFWNPIVLIPFIFGVWGLRASSRSFLLAASSGIATVLAWKIGLVQGAGLFKSPLIPSMIANGIVLLLARHFDTPEARGEQHNNGKQTGGGGMPKPGSLHHIFSFKPLLDSLPTPKRYYIGCSWRARLFQIPYPSFAGTTIGCILLASIVSLKPNMPHFHWLVALRSVAAVLCVLVLLRQYLPVSLLNKHLPAYWFAQNTFVWPCINTFAWLNMGGDLPSLGFWVIGFVFLSLVVDLRSTIYMSVVGSVLGWIMYGALGGSHTVTASLLAVPLEAWCLGMPLVVGAVLFPRSREAFAWGQATALRMRCIMANHDLGGPLSALQQQAIQLNKHLDELIRAHQTVCQTDKSFTSLSKKQYASLRDFGKHFQESIRKAIDFAEAMLGNIKDPMQFTAKTGIVNLKEALEKAIGFGLTLEQQQRVRVKQTEDAWVYGNLTHLSHGFANVLVNAAKHSPKETKIDVWLKNTSDGPAVRVRDYGKGCKNSHLPYLFDPFYSHTEGGTGSGLAYCKQLMNQLDGDIYAANAPGGGMQFDFEFPLVPKDVLEEHREEQKRKKEKAAQRAQQEAEEHQQKESQEQEDILTGSTKPFSSIY
ncbi:MAG: ATP-binding protein, partial [Myxococcota bacterium]